MSASDVLPLPLPETLVTLTCNVQTTNSDETTIVWLFEGLQDIVGTWENEGFVKRISDSKLQLSEVSAARQGRYSCCVLCGSSSTIIKTCSPNLLVSVKGKHSFSSLVFITSVCVILCCSL